MLQHITTENFNQLLGRFSTSELEDLVEKSPYFQQAHLLLAKKYQLENNPKFDQQLQVAALYTQDRELLFNIFSEKTTPVTKLTVQTFTEPVAEQKEHEVVLQQPIVTLPAELPVAAITETPKEEVITADVAKLEMAAPEEIQKAAIQEKPQIQEEEAFSTDEPHSFDEWLHVFNKLPALAKIDESTLEKTEEEKDIELDRIIATSASVDYLHDQMKEETQYSKGLDKFIEEQIQKHRHEEITPPASENDISPDIITETMAKVYEKQKKYTKAIKAYEILTLKFPEKNDFFAARINYLKNII